MVNVLAFDCATEVLNIGLSCEGRFESRSIKAGLNHAEHLMPNTLDLLNRANLTLNDINLIVCTKGPGSFTGLRIGMATAKGISLGLHIPLVSVPTLQVYQLPYSWFNQAVLPVIDAKKQRYYGAIYKNGTAITEIMDGSPGDFAKLLNGFSSVLVTGPDAKPFAQLLKTEIPQTTELFTTFSTYDHAESLIQLGTHLFTERGSDRSTSGPLYIRKSDAELALDASKRG